jgi:hypothetical protein
MRERNGAKSITCTGKSGISPRCMAGAVAATHRRWNGNFTPDGAPQPIKESIEQSEEQRAKAPAGRT